MTKKRIIRDSVFNENVVNTNFDNVPSTTVFRLGRFTLDSNLDGRVIQDFSNRITTFSKEYTLETINLDESASEKIFKDDNKLKLNLNFNEISSYSRYGSVEDLLKFSIKNIIEKYPYSIRVVNQLNTGIINTVLNHVYNSEENTSTFNIPTLAIINIFNIIIDSNNNVMDNDNPLINLNQSLDKYVIWSEDDPNKEYKIISFNGSSKSDNFINITVKGRVFDLENSTLSKTFHIKPSKKEFIKFLNGLNDIEKYFLNKKNQNGYTFKLKDIKEDGRTIFTKNLIWPVSDGYNIDVDTVSYNIFLDNLIKLGINYDQFKSDIIYRLYTTESLKEFDNTNNKKIKKLIRTYGFEFDKIKRMVDGFATLSNLSYKKEKSIPDILIKNLSRTLGWDTFNILGENDLMNKILTVRYDDVHKSTIPCEIDIELWRRILINTKWFFKSKGTRKSIETIFKLIGIPEDFIYINEYIYLAENKLTSDLTIDSITRNEDIGINVINPPTYNNRGYPISVKENNEFFFQISGNTDSGQTYINRFRENGFVLDELTDNKKSWVYVKDNFIERNSLNTFYSLNDSELIINTKEIDVGLNPSKALEKHVFEVNKQVNFPISSSGVTSSILYVNIPLNVTSPNQTVFEIPDIPEGDIQVNLNGITLSKDDDYTISGSNNNIITLIEPAINNMNGVKDIISVTYINDFIDNTRNFVEYVVMRIGVTENGQSLLNLPDEPLGDIQLVLNGITLKPGKNAFDGDFYQNPINKSEIIITFQDINESLYMSDIVTVMYIKEVNNDDDIIKYNDSHVITSFFNNKIYYNNLINRYVYNTDYTITDINSIKITINGITITNGVDFILDPLNKSRILFSQSVVLKINDIINAYYVINTNPFSDSVNIGLNIYNITFPEYVNSVFNNLIDVKNRKIITDNNGGTYPKLSFLYDSYIKTGINNSNVNTYEYKNLYNFIKKYDNNFLKFLNQLLPATVITRKSGLIISNNIFSSQKYRYIRGINDGSEFITNIETVNCDLFNFTVGTSPAKSMNELGSILINAEGFNNSVEYSIDNGQTFSLNNEFMNLLPNEYNIVLKDSVGCVVSGITSVDIDCSNFELIDIIKQDVESDINLGNIEIIASGDTNILYSIDGGNIFTENNNFNNLNQGEYNIVIKNSLDCVITGTTTVDVICDINIENESFNICDPDINYDRNGSSLTLINNQLALYVVYNFVPDDNFNRYFREKLTITETETSQVILEKWVDFEIGVNEDNIDLGNIFIYSNVPNYINFNFEVSYSDEIISCDPITDPLPEQIFNPLPEQSEATFDLSATILNQEWDGEYYNFLFGVQITNPLEQNLNVNLRLSYVDDSNTGFIETTIMIPQGVSDMVTTTNIFINSTSQDDTIFGNVCIESIDYIGSENINIIDEC